MAAIFQGKNFIPIAATMRVGLIQVLAPMKKFVASLLLIALAAPLAYYGVGYAAASRKSAACEELAFKEATEKNIHGVNVTGKSVAVQRSAVVSSVSPFLVEVTYSVPRDLHATVFTKIFHVSAWGTISPGKLKIIYLV